MRTPFVRFFSILGLLSLCPLFSNALVLTGSDLFSESFRDVLMEELDAAGLKVVVSFDGSLLGLRNLQNEIVDASILALPDTTEMQTALRKFPLCFQVAAAAVHESNPVSELSYRQLADLYLETGSTDSWSAFTKDISWTNRNINLFATRLDNSIAVELFNAMVLKGERLRNTLQYATGSDTEIQSLIAENQASIVLMPVMDITGPVKFLGVKRTQDEQAYTPSLDNVFFGDYPLRLPFYLVVSEGLDEEQLGTILKVLYSEPVTAALEKDHFLPIPSAEKRAILNRFK